MGAEQDLFDRESYSEGGGLLDDVDVLVKSARFGLTDYRGSAQTKSTAFLLTMETDDGEEHEEIYSIGRKAEKAMRAKKEGRGLEPKQGQQAVQLNVNCKAGRFFLSLIELDFQGSGSDPSILEGMRFHVRRKALPKLENVADSKDTTVLLVTDILEAGKSASKSAGKTHSGGKGKTNGLEVRAAELIQKVLEDAGKPLSMTDVRRGVFKLTKGESDGPDIVEKVSDDAWISELPMFELDGGKLALA